MSKLLKSYYDLSDRVVRVDHDSQQLAGNPWDDPTSRQVTVYLPPDYEDSESRYPVIWYLAAFTNSGAAVSNWRGFQEGLFQRIERLIKTDAMGPVIVAAPDCFTALGGNQYIDSPGVGRYAAYVHRELVPLIDDRFRTLAGRQHRAVVGKSSGGYGALRWGMQYPQFWSAIACHSGDVGFEWCYKPDFPDVATRLARCDASAARFLEQFWESEQHRRGEDFNALMHLCLAATYDPDPDDPANIRLPFDAHTLEMIPERWARWAANDPLNLVAEYVNPLKSLRCIYMDCGNRDQYRIQFGCRRLSRLLRQHGVNHSYEEFDGTHSQIDHRLNESLPVLYGAIKP